MRPKFSSLSVSALLLVLLLRSAFGQESTQPVLFKPEIKRVAIFKNGYVLTYREGQARMTNGWAYTTDVPIGVLGTVWGYSTTPQVRVTQLLASEADRKENFRVGSLEELLVANEAAHVRLHTFQDKVHDGELLVLNSRPETSTATTRAGDEETPESTSARSGTPIIALKTAEGILAFRLEQIAYVEILGQPKLNKVITLKEHRLAIKTEGGSSTQPVGLGVAALERGIRWIPAYRLEVKGDPIREAKLELEAMVINELTDIREGEMYFVVGVPHFLYRDILSPLSLSSTFAGVSSYFSQASANQYANAIMTQAGGDFRASGTLQNPSPSSPTVMEEEQAPSLAADELFLYRADRINLRKGERASLRLFSLTVPCSEVFEWTIADQPPPQPYGNQPPIVDLRSSIWYALKLKNQTSMPWTTGPALSFREWKPLGQDILTFTPVGTDTIVRVTPATDVMGVHRQEEKQRVRTTLRQNGADYEYDLITVEATVKLRNLRRQPIDIGIRRTLTGAVEEVSDKGMATREGFDLQSVNPRTNLKWELNLPPGEKELRYVYKVYVKR
jgi:hypothetical protein